MEQNIQESKEERNCPLCQTQHSLDNIPPLEINNTHVNNNASGNEIMEGKDKSCKLQLEGGKVVTLSSYIARGFFSKVFEGTLEGTRVAAKIYLHPISNTEFQKKFHREVYVLSIVSGHKNIIKYFGYGFTSDHLPFIVTSFGGQNLESLIFKSAEEELKETQNDEALEPASKKSKLTSSSEQTETQHQSENTLPTDEEILMAVLSALQYCHVKHGIAHCDLKLSNILFDTSTRSLTLTDWNSATYATAPSRAKRISAQQGDLNSLGRLMLRIKYEVQGNLTAKIIKELMSQVDSNWKTVLESLLESSSSDPDIYDKIMEIVAKIE